MKRTPDGVAYRFYNKKTNRWEDVSWQQAADRVAHMQAALAQENLKPGDRVAIMAGNSPQWVHFEQAAIGLGLVIVPLYTNDRADNIAYVLQDAGVKLFLVEGDAQLDVLDSISSQLDGLIRLLTIETCNARDQYTRLMSLELWIDAAIKAQEGTAVELITKDVPAEDLVSIVYTSGTTGRPKGVMLSHRNIAFNAKGGTKAVQIYREDLFLSFLPLSHMLERTVGYYIPMICGSTMAFARSVQDLAEDLTIVKPTILVSVPRIYERVYGKINTQLSEKSGLARALFHKAVQVGWERFKNPNKSYLLWPILNALVAKKITVKMGGRLRLAICGGAPLAQDVAKTFIGLGMNIVQGYGLTETSPIISANRLETNDPSSVGHILDGVEVKIGENDELLTRSPSVMLGYWNNKQATDDIIDSDGWLHTGDKAEIRNDRVYITGRIKEIIVLSNGEKVPPADMELAIAMNPVFEQVMVIGENKPYLSALIVLSHEHWPKFAQQLKVSEDAGSLREKSVVTAVLEAISEQMKEFPGYAQIRQVALTLDPWTVDNGLITPTLKIKRAKIMEKFHDQVEKLYEGH